MKQSILAAALCVLVLSAFHCSKDDDKADTSYGCSSTFIRKQATNMSGKLYYIDTKGWAVDLVFAADNEGYKSVVCNPDNAQLQVAIQGLATNGTRYDVTVSGKIKDAIPNQGTQTPGSSYPLLYYITIEAISK